MVRMARVTEGDEIARPIAPGLPGAEMMDLQAPILALPLAYLAAMTVSVQDILSDVGVAVLLPLLVADAFDRGVLDLLEVERRHLDD